MKLATDRASKVSTTASLRNSSVKRKDLTANTLSKRGVLIYGTPRLFIYFIISDLSKTPGQQPQAIVRPGGNHSEDESGTII